ncbi:hypothetical protein EOM82_00950 [bacterium]|nr:hypothetical protein [bacterium]
MRKSYILKLVILCALFVIIFAISGCTNLPDGYVEVESLRIESANVYLSPSGETAKKQLNVEILPANATNRKLNYYIPSEYLKYAMVDESGLITALLTTEEGMLVPLTVTSSTNKKASLKVNIVVEYVAVKEVSFTETKIDMLYNSEGVQLNVKYTPYHAQDGRAVAFSSLNEGVATVSPSGVVTPIALGRTHILATCKTSTGKEVQGRIPVIVNYAKGRYRLEASDTNPKYNQVLGQKDPINFRVLILDNQSDPNPRIQWYVDSEKVIGNSSLQYEHRPNVSTRTSYYVTVKIAPYNEEEQTLTSEKITIFQEFTGFDLDILNYVSNTKAYQYGDEETFSLTTAANNVVYYEWYLKKKNTIGKGIYVGNTPVQNKDLIRRLNLDGDFILSAEGKDSIGNTVSIGQSFEFGVTRFTIGDTLVLSPQIFDFGMEPESYNWYKYDVDEEGNRTSGSVFVGSSVQGDNFYYPLTSNGNIELVALAMLDGVVAKANGVPFEGSTGIIRVYGSSPDGEYESDIINFTNQKYDYAVNNNVAVNYLIIDGVNKAEEMFVNIHWNLLGASSAYVVEIIKENGDIYLIDSADNPEYFGANFVNIPEDIVRLSDKFSVRVKQKGGLFSERYFYGQSAGASDDKQYYFDAIEEEHYSYLKLINSNVNSYVLSVRELGEILDYIMLFNPTSNPLVKYELKTENSIIYNAFTVKLVIDIEYDEYLEEKYPVSIEEGVVEKDYENLYKMLLGAQQSYCETGEYKLILSYNEDDDSYNITVMKAAGVQQLKTTENISIIAGDSIYYSQNPYGEGYDSFYIYTRNDLGVSTTDQLYSVAENGYSPIPSNDAVATVYTKAKNIVKAIIDAGMTDRQKVLAFFDYLTTNIAYDFNILTLMESEEESIYSIYDYDSFHLEGVFNKKKAVCDGIAKAMSLLCAIEGIVCNKISLTVNGVGHSFNKVLIDGEYYYVDATYGIKRDANGVQYANHKYFMMLESDVTSYYQTPVIFGEYPNADASFDFYGETLINGNSLLIISDKHLNDLLNGFGTELTKKVYIEVKMSEEFLNGTTIEDIISAISLQGSLEIYEFILLGDSRVVIVLE